MKPLCQDMFLLWFQQVGGAAPAPGVDIPSGAFVAKITNDAREDEMEENMEQVPFHFESNNLSSRKVQWKVTRKKLKVRFVFTRQELSNIQQAEPDRSNILLPSISATLKRLSASQLVSWSTSI